MRSILFGGLLFAVGLSIACGEGVSPTPVVQTVLVQQTVVVEKEKPVEKVVQQTVIVVATAAPEPTATSRPKATPKGEVVVALEDIPALVQLPSKDSGSSTGGFGTWTSIYDTLVRAPWDPPGTAPNFDTYEGGIASSWKVAPDRSTITFKIRKGVQFHHGWGEVTAQDVVWTMNEAIKEGSVSNGGEQLSPGLKGGWAVGDDSTAVMKIALGAAGVGKKLGGFDPTWPLQFGNAWAGTLGIVSKKAFDDLGATKFNTTEIGTGPYKTVSWKADDEVVAEALEDNWRVIPKLKRARYVEMPELATRQAALKTGEVHIAVMPAKTAKDVLNAIPGARSVSVGTARPTVVFFAGNYWGVNCPTCAGGKITTPRPGFKPDNDHPWIGDPKNPARMESARKVRWAMAMAIDREQIIKTVMGGNARLIYTHANILPDSPLHKPGWVIPFDPAKAKQYLTEAGYPTGFSVTLWRAPNVPIWEPEIGDAVAQMWRQNLGLKVTVESTVYAARRPTTVDNTIDIPFIHGINYFSPIEDVVGFIGANAGHHAGIEVEDPIFEIGSRNATETDLKKREQNTVAVQDYVSYQMLVSPVLQTGIFFVYRPEVVEWRPYATTQEVFTNPESIVMK